MRHSKTVLKEVYSNKHPYYKKKKTQVNDLTRYMKEPGEKNGEGNGTPLQYSFAWKIPRTEEPGRLQSMVSRRVGHD